MAVGALKPSYVSPIPVADEPSYGEQYARLLDAALRGDFSLIKRLSSDFAREYQGRDQNSVKAQIGHMVRTKSVSLDSVPSLDKLPVDSKSRSFLIEEQPWPTTTLLLNDNIEHLLSRFVNEALNADLLAREGLGTRMNLLLSGPPGTGKTFIAAHLAARLGLPFYVVRLDSLVSSLLGDTAKNIRAIFEFVSHKAGFLFLDEVDAIAKRRDDPRELGEIKRVVNTLIQGLDYLNDRSIVVAATNHAHLLDPAIFRRFPYFIEIGLPDIQLRESLWQLYLPEEKTAAIYKSLAKLSDGLSCSDIRELAVAYRRASILTTKPHSLAGICLAIISSSEGKIAMPMTAEFSRGAETDLKLKMKNDYHLSNQEIAGLLKISKEAVRKVVLRERHK